MVFWHCLQPLSHTRCALHAQQALLQNTCLCIQQRQSCGQATTCMQGALSATNCLLIRRAYTGVRTSVLRESACPLKRDLSAHNTVGCVGTHQILCPCCAGRRLFVWRCSATARHAARAPLPHPVSRPAVRQLPVSGPEGEQRSHDHASVVSRRFC